MKKHATHISRGLALLLLLWAPATLAQKVEITPFVNLPFGAELETDRFDDSVEFDIDDGSGYGLNVGFTLVGGLQLELFWSHQESDLVAKGGFFFEDLTITDLEIDYYHAGVLFQFGDGQFQPFIAGSLGVTEFSPGNAILEDESRFSVGVGMGAKIFFNKSFGLRLEARAFTTLIDEGDDVCDGRFCYYEEGTYFIQGEFRGGLIFAF